MASARGYPYIAGLFYPQACGPVTNCLVYHQPLANLESRNTPRRRGDIGHCRVFGICAWRFRGNSTQLTQLPRCFFDLLVVHWTVPAMCLSSVAKAYNVALVFPTIKEQMACRSAAPRRHAQTSASQRRPSTQCRSPHPPIRVARYPARAGSRGSRRRWHPIRRPR